MISLFIRHMLLRFLRGPALLAAPLLTAVLTAVLFLLVAPPARAACSVGACVTVGPRLASVSSTQSALLNPLLGGLLGTSLNLSVTDWNTLAGGNVNLLSFLNALQVQANASTPAQALTTSLTLAQITAALQTAASVQANTSLSGVLSTLASQVSGIGGGTVRVGDLLKVGVDAGGVASTTINSLDMLTGLAQLYNQKNVLTTPTPIGISGGVLGMAGVLNSVQLYVQAIEPPLYICGPSGTQFHTAAVRVKLKLDLVTVAPVTSLLTALPGVYAATIAIGQMDLYIEVARAEGVLGAVDAVAKSVTVQAAPGVADVYLGTMDDSVFFNRNHVLNAATDLTYGKIGKLQLNALNVDIEVKSAARGEAPFSSTQTFTGTFPQTRTISSSTAFTTNLVNSLVNNLSLRTTPSLGLLDAVVLPVLKGVVTGVLTPILTPVLTGVADPLLQLLGIGLGQMVVTVNGIASACDDFKLTKAVDKADAAPGSAIVYTITYQNTGTTILTGMKVLDATPAFTVYADGACGTLGAGLTGCTFGTHPAAGATGALEWQFTGALQPGATGTVTFKALVQ